jgi:hypothetical protein
VRRYESVALRENRLQNDLTVADFPAFLHEQNNYSIENRKTGSAGIFAVRRRLAKSVLAQLRFDSLSQNGS